MKFSNGMLQIAVTQTTMVHCVFEQDAVLTIILVSRQKRSIYLCNEISSKGNLTLQLLLGKI